MELELESELESESESELESSLPPAILQESNENSQEVQAILEINGMEQVPEADSQQFLYNRLSKERNIRQKYRPDDIISDHLISKHDEIDGLWVLCKVCSKASGNYATICIALNNKEKKNPACITLHHLY